MARVDLRKFALRLKVVEMLRLHWQQRQQEEAGMYWRHMILPN